MINKVRFSKLEAARQDDKIEDLRIFVFFD